MMSKLCAAWLSDEPICMAGVFVTSYPIFGCTIFAFFSIEIDLHNVCMCVCVCDDTTFDDSFTVSAKVSSQTSCIMYESVAFTRQNQLLLSIEQKAHKHSHALAKELR